MRDNNSRGCVAVANTQEWEEKLDGKFVTMMANINLNIDHQMESSTNKIITQASNLHAIVGMLAHEI